MEKFRFLNRSALAICLAATAAFAYFQRHEAGQEVFSFTSTFQSPRSAALEFSAAAAPSTDLGITLLNPAAIRIQEGKNNAAGVYWETGDFAENQGTIAYARQLSTMTVQATYGWIAYGDIDGYDESGNETGETYSPLSQLFALSASIPLRWIQTGVTVKMVTDKLADDDGDRMAIGLAFDWGISWLSKSNRLGLSLTARDFGAMLRDYTDDGEDDDYAMAETFALSAFFIPRFLPRLTIFAESTFPRYSECALRLGAEYALSKYFFLRAGFSRTWLDLTRDFKELVLSDSRPGESNEARLFSLGLGYAYGPVGLDYAFSYLTQGLGSEHRLGLRFSF